MSIARAGYRGWKGTAVLRTAALLALLFTARSGASGPEPIEFSAPPDGARLRVAAVGDVLLHARLQSQAYLAAVTSQVPGVWDDVKPLLRSAGVAYANLEGTVAPGLANDGTEDDDPGPIFDGHVYTSFPTINYHPSVLPVLSSSGIRVVSTANNHALDRGPEGVTKTLDALDAAGILATGTRRDSSSDRYAVTTFSGFRLAWVGCTQHTNGLADSEDQVQYCFRNQKQLLALIEDLSSTPGIDAVIVTPHWGKQFEFEPSPNQVEFAHAALDAGALAVLGSHPHVLQPWEKYVTQDGRETLAVYSLGNFVSGQVELECRVSILLQLDLTRDSAGVTRLAFAGYVPLLMKNRRSPCRLVALRRDHPDPEAASALELLGEILPQKNMLAPRPTPGPTAR
ncbi:MAG: CapA family protein [Candidatus Wallbacteria bacterium]|nr:CapA family protein [Candidatus Wallbacteria bacterium]